MMGDNDANLTALETEIRDIRRWRRVAIAFWTWIALPVTLELVLVLTLSTGDFLSTDRIYVKIVFVLCHLVFVFPAQTHTETVTKKVYPNLSVSLRKNLGLWRISLVLACMLSGIASVWACVHLYHGGTSYMSGLIVPCQESSAKAKVDLKLTCVNERFAYLLWTGAAVGLVYAADYLGNGRFLLSFPALQEGRFSRFKGALPQAMLHAFSVSLVTTRLLGLVFWIAGRSSSSWLLYPAQWFYSEPLYFRVARYTAVDLPLALHLMWSGMVAVLCWEVMRLIREITMTQAMHFSGGTPSLPYLMIALGTEQQQYTGYAGGAESLPNGPVVAVDEIGPYGSDGGKESPPPEPSLFWLPITGVNLRTGNFVDSLQFVHGNSIAPRIGGSDGTVYDFVLAEDEAITRVDGSCGAVMDSIRFITNRGRSFGPFGGRGPNTFSVTAPPGSALVGVRGTTCAAPSSLEGKGSNIIQSLTFIVGSTPGATMRYADNPLLPNIPTHKQPDPWARSMAFLDLATSARFGADTRRYVFADDSGRLWDCISSQCLQVTDVLTQALHFSSTDQKARQALRSETSLGLVPELRLWWWERLAAWNPLRAPVEHETLAATLYGQESSYSQWKARKIVSRRPRALKDILSTFAAVHVPWVRRTFFVAQSSSTAALFTDSQAQIWAVRSLALFAVAAYTEDHHGVVQRSLPRVLNSMIACLLAVEDHMAEMARTSGRLPGRAYPQPNALAQVLRTSIYHIVTTYYEKLTAFAFPPKYAAKLQEFASFAV